LSISTLPMKRILFVDDEPSIRGIYNMLPSVLGPDYSVTTAGTPEEGLSQVANEDYDVVVSDLMMPGMSGAELLSRVARISPSSIRVVVSGFADELTLAKCLLAGHRYFTKPFNPVRLTESLHALSQAREAVACGKISSLVGKMESLPTPSDTYLALIKALNSDSNPITRIADILERDPSLCAKILQAVNSAMFGSGRAVVCLTEALQLLGLQVLKALILTIQVFDFYQNPKLKEQLEQIWTHSSKVARRARHFAAESGWAAEICNEAFFAGLLHDIGRVVLIASPEQERHALFPEYDSAHDDFSAHFALSHAVEAEAGAYLLSIWGIPETIVTAVRTFRCVPGEPSAASAAAAVGIAHELEMSPGIGGEMES
jgi:HD-like signal output (HDOD) protein/CheY-like chemotaxis protein